MKLHLISLQFGLFFSDVVYKPYPMFEDLNKHMLNIFDGNPTMMDVPAMLPVDVPLINLKSENNAYLCNISRSRIDIFLNRIEDNSPNHELLNDFNSKIESFVKYVFGKVQVNRFGLICRYFAPCENPIKSISEKYLNPTEDGWSELGLRFNSPSEFKGLKINNVVEINSRKMKNKDQDFDGVFIQRDINNHPLSQNGLDLDLLDSVSKSYAKYVSEQSIGSLIK